MSIKGELTKTASYLRSARKAILGRGGEISLTAGLKDLSDAIYKIPADASLVYQVDDSVAYRKIVPIGAEEFAQVAKVGGMTRKCNNLIKSYNVGNSQTTNGVTITYNEDGSYTLNGTATNAFSFVLSIIDKTLNGSYTTSLNYALPSGCSIYGNTTDGSSNADFIATGTQKTINFSNKPISYVRMWVNTNAVFENTTYYVMLNEGSTALPYEPYFEGLRDTAVTELKSEGANQFNINAPLDANTGTTLSVIDEHTIRTTTTKSTSTPGSSWLFSALKNISIPIETKEIYVSTNISINGKQTKGTLTARIVDEAGNALTQKVLSGVGFVSNRLTRPTDYQGKKLYLRMLFYSCAGEVCDAGDYIEYSNTMASFDADVPYSPYGTIDTFPIAEEIQAIDGYGRGVEGYPNYIDFEKKVFVQNTYRKVINGKEPWTSAFISGRNMYRYSILLADAVNPVGSKMICSNYNKGDWYKDDYPCYYGGDTNKVFLLVETYPTVEELKAHLAELYASGNPLVVEYALETPIETDISAYLGNDSFIAVEGGGSITAVNEYEYDAPSTINYIAKVGT